MWRIEENWTVKCSRFQYIKFASAQESLMVESDNMH